MPNWKNIETEGLPTRGGGDFPWTSAYVLVAKAGGQIGIGSYDYDRSVWTYNMAGHNEMDDNNVTHWMELPSPP